VAFCLWGAQNKRPHHTRTRLGHPPCDRAASGPRSEGELQNQRDLRCYDPPAIPMPSRRHSSRSEKCSRISRGLRDKTDPLKFGLRDKPYNFAHRALQRFKIRKVRSFSVFCIGRGTLFTRSNFQTDGGSVKNPFSSKGERREFSDSRKQIASVGGSGLGKQSGRSQALAARIRVTTQTVA
jgi:hypothetical protein